MSGRIPTPAEIRAARAFLRGRNISSDQIPPRRFASSAKELDMGFRELLAFIRRMMAGGQGQQEQRRENVARIAERS